MEDSDKQSRNRLNFESRNDNYNLSLHGNHIVQWVPATSRGPLPSNAILGGRDTDGAQIYVGRAHHEGELIPCKVLPTKQVAYVAHNGSEISKHSFEILIGSDVKWKRERNGKIPQGAYPGGHAKGGETLYIGRAEHSRSLTVGKVHPSHGCLYISYGGAEIALRDYEVLTGN